MEPTERIELMKRVCFVLQVKPELVEEYKKAHEPVWPEMLKAMSDAGIRNYSIFLKPNGELINCLEAEDPEESLRKVGETDVCRRWQEYMSPYFVPSSGGHELVEEVFFIA
jgi:L-rhamnose mutarotase